MAQIFPTIENINRLKVKPTEGEWFLIKDLIQNLPEEVEIYFQPFLNGDMPDIILMQKDVGVTIIEVKDWNLNLYKINPNNEWHLKSNSQLLRSPFKQVFTYKNNMFNLHIDGLLKEKLNNKNFYERIKTYVYFHTATRVEINNFFNQTLNQYNTLLNDCNSNYKSFSSHQEYEKKCEYLKQKKSKIERDLRLAVGNDNLNKIALPQGHVLFTEKIYKEFHRYLQPPYHTLNQGKDIKYSKNQEKFIVSQNKHEKILGVAGSGKTTVLAKRAVNAHKRHEGKVLILTYNITLKSYIHDRISDVRDDFSWSEFYVVNYHQFITQELNNLNIESDIDTFSNIKLFENNKHKIKQKYKTILIDEIQDYEPNWIKILRAYFLENDSEMVLFGDEKQNIYNNELDDQKRPVRVNGFGSWRKLTKSIRHQGIGGRILELAQQFQKEFFINKYEVDDLINITPSLSLDLFKLKKYDKNKINNMVENILLEMRTNNIHNDDVVILGSKIDFLKEVDFMFRTNFNIKTITSFETKEMGEKLKNENEIRNIRKNKKISFNHHSGKLKISTIHSFKGYEAETVFLIIDENNKQEVLDDNLEMIYTGITRSRFNIVVFALEDSQYSSFFKKYLEVDYEESVQKLNQKKSIGLLTKKRLTNKELRNELTLNELKTLKTNRKAIDEDEVSETITKGLVLGGLGLLFGLPF